jgi:G3E family GTPase
MSKKISVNLVTGLLGAGKTTFIKRVIEERSSFETMLIVVNDFGEIDIDGRRLETVGGGSVLKLPNGCICCSLKKDLMEKLPQFLSQFTPQRVLIEPSGISEPSQVLASLNEIKAEKDINISSVITLIDSSNYFDSLSAFGAFFEEQIEIADSIIINKTDLSSPEEVKEIKKDLRKRNNTALIWSTKKAKVPLEIVLNTRKEKIYEPKINERREPSFETLTFPLPAALSLKKIENLLKEAERGSLGEVLRIKGFASTKNGSFYIDFSGKKWSLEECEAQEPALIFIGKNLKREKIRERLR